MEFKKAMGIINGVLKKINSEIDESAYDGLIVKELKASNTLDSNRTTNQTHIAITGNQMDMFPYVRADGYFEVDYQNEDNSLKKYFVAQIPVYLHKENVDYMDCNANLFTDSERLTHVSIVRSRRNGAADQLQMSMINIDSPEYVAYRKIVHAGTYMILLKRKEKLEYDLYSVKPKDADDLKTINNSFFKLPTNTVVKTDELLANNGIDNEYDVMNHSLYGIHIKNLNDALSDENPHICIGWSTLGDLSHIEKKNELAAIYDQRFENKNARAKGQDVGQIWRFMDELKIGDYVFFSDDAVCHIGRVTSEYFYDEEERSTQDSDYKNSRSVEWLKKDIDRKELSDALHRCLATAMSIWSMNDYKSAALELLNGTYVKDDEGNTDYIAAEDQEEEFRTWMSSVPKNSSGELYSVGTIATYIRCMKKAYREFDSYKGYASIFDIQSAEELDAYRQYLFNAEGFEDFEIKNGNRACSNGIIKYGEYLDKDSYHFVSENSSEVTDVATFSYETADPYTKEDFLAEVFMDGDKYDTLVRLLEHKRNVILQGAPGVGKTFLAKRLAYSIMGEKEKSHVEMIQFHQNYSYEDFIMGYKPNGDGFELRTGVFYNFCKKAEADKNPESRYYFIIDEINRGNMSKIFGELMMLVEGDKRGEKIKLAYRDEMFGIPDNLYIIGMMNTADRSLAIMDYALRRRFSFFDVEPAFGKKSLTLELQKNIGSQNVVDRVVRYLTALNEKIADEEKSGLGKGFCIGHSYFLVPPVAGESDEDWYDNIIEFEIAPLLEEYWWDDKDTADDCISELKKK